MKEVLIFIKNQTAKLMFAFIARIWYNILKKVKGSSIARPREVRLEGGTVYLHGFTPERAEEITALLVKPIEVGTVVEVTETEVKTVDVNDMPLSTAGMYQDKDTKKFMTVQINYNPYNDLAKIVKKKIAGDFRLAGVNTLKMDLVDLNLV